MKLYLRIVLPLIFAFSFLTISAQTVVTGRVLDARTKEPLPFCKVYFTSNKAVTKTDNFGNFTLKTSSSESVFFVSQIGYEMQEVKIIGSEFKTDVILNVKSKKKKEVVIKSNRKLEKDTLAIRIMRNVIKNKDQNKPSSFSTVQFDKYTKFEVDVANIDSVLGSNFLTKPLKYMLDYQNTTPDGERYSPLLMRETVAKVFQKGKKVKTEVLGVQDTKLFDNESLYSLVSYAFEDYNIYDNQLIIANKSMIGPAATGALIFYRYYVEDSSVVDGKKNYHMLFAPISKNDFGFTGNFVVEEGSWAIKDAHLFLDKRANINYINHFAISQAFEKLGTKWVRTKDEKDIALSISRSAKKFIKVRFRQSDIHSNYVVDQEISDDIFYGDEVVMKQGYNKTNEEFWKKNRTEKLTDFEAGFYKRSDTFRKSKQYLVLKYMMRVGTTAFFPIPPVNWEIGRAYKFVSWNEYEGMRLRLGARMVFDSFKRFNIGGHIAYGLNDKRTKYGLEGMFNLPTRNLLFHQLNVTMLHDYQRLGDAEPLLDFDNIAMSIFRNPENRIKDIVLKDLVKVMWTKEWKKGEETTLGFDNTVYHANNYFTLNEIMPDGSIVPRDQINTFRVNASYRFALKEPVFRNAFKRMRMKSIRPIFDVSTTIGFKDVMGSDYGFMKMKVGARQQVPHIAGQFRYNLTAGKIFGKVPYIDVEQLAGNNSLIRDVNRFYMMNEAEYTVDQFAQLFLSQHFQGFFFNKIPLLKKLGWRENLYFKGVVGSISDENKNYFKLPNQTSAPEGIYMESGFGISNIFNVIEVDFMWRMTQHDKPNTRKFGILLGALFEI